MIETADKTGNKTMRKHLDISAYLVVGRENTFKRPVGDIVNAALTAGFTCVQLRSKEESVHELLEDCRVCAELIARLGLSERITLLVDDRLDVALAARDVGIKVDGVHVGQSDIPVKVCRKYLGEDAVVGLSAPTQSLIEYVKTADLKGIDYLGAGPLHPTPTKRDCGLDANGTVITRTLNELTDLAALSPVPVVVGGGVKVSDIAALKATGVAGFFVVSAVAAASDPHKAAQELCKAWGSK